MESRCSVKYLFLLILFYLKSYILLLLNYILNQTTHVKYSILLLLCNIQLILEHYRVLFGPFFINILTLNVPLIQILSFFFAPSLHLSFSPPSFSPFLLLSFSPFLLFSFSPFLLFSLSPYLLISFSTSLLLYFSSSPSPSLLLLSSP